MAKILNIDFSELRRSQTFFPALAGFQRESPVGKYECVTLNVTRTKHERNTKITAIEEFSLFPEDI